LEAADRAEVRVERARCMARNNEIKRIKRREKYNPGEITGSEEERKEMEKAGGEMKPKSRKFSRRFLHPQSLAAETARTIT